jgi:CRP-like cAMP-binding protein
LKVIILHLRKNSQGEVEVVVGNKVVTTLGEGGFFGEIAILFESKRTATIRARTYCDISTLIKSGLLFYIGANFMLDLDKCLKSFPEQKSIITEMAQLRMSKDSLREKINTDLLFRDVQPHDQFVAELQKYFKPRHCNAGDLIYHAGSIPQILQAYNFR